MTDSGKKVMIVTGEASGDLHGAEVIRAINSLAGDTDFFGAGGDRMAKEGCQILVPGENLAVMGIVEVLGQFRTIWCAFQVLKKKLIGTDRPDALVLIDFPEFNLRLAKIARAAGVPVLYYVSPQVWAWRRGRVKKIAKVVDSLAAILPFEPALYDGLDIHVEYVGHPLLDEYEASGESKNLKKVLNVPEETQLVGLFPGSRKNEIKYMLDTIVDTARLLSEQIDPVHFVVPVAAGLNGRELKDRFPDVISMSFVEQGQQTIYDIASSCDAILTVSGTVTLQIALTGTPMAILYKLSPISYAIGKHLVKVDHIGLANIVADKRVVQEFVQEEATPEQLVEEMVKLLSDETYSSNVRDGLHSIRSKLGEPGCSGRVAKMLMEMLEVPSESKHV